MPVRLKIRGDRKWIVVPKSNEFTPEQAPKPVTGLQNLIVQEHRRQSWLDNGRLTFSSEIGKKEKIDPRYVQRVLKYALPAPNLVELILSDEIKDGIATHNITNEIILVRRDEQRGMFL